MKNKLYKTLEFDPEKLFKMIDIDNNGRISIVDF